MSALCLAGRTLGWVFSLILASVGLAAADPCPTECPSGKIPLGISVPQSGPAAAFGQSTAKAIEVAVSELNKKGGILGIPVETIFGDDRCDVGMAARVANRLIETHKIGYLIGPTCPAVATEAAPVYAKAGVIQFVPTVTAVGLTQQYSDTMFRMVATDEQEAQAIAAYLAREQSGKSFAVVHSTFFYRRAMARMIELALSPEQKASTHFEPLPDVSGAYDRLADQMRRNPPDVIYISLDSEQVIEFVQKLREKGVKSLLIGGQHLLSQGFWKTSQSTAEVIHVVAPIDSLDNPALKSSADLLRQNDVVPDIVTMSNFAAVQVWAEAVSRAGSGDPKRVVAKLRADTFDTAVGQVAFDQRGDRRNIRYTILSWKNGRVVVGLQWRQ